MKKDILSQYTVQLHTLRYCYTELAHTCHTPYSLYTWLSHAIITAGPGAHYSRQHEEDLWLGTLPEASSLFQVAHAASASERRMVPVWLRSTWLGLGLGIGSRVKG